MSQTPHPFVISEGALDSGDPEQVLYSVLSYLQVLGEEGADVADVHPAALTVHALNTLDAQVTNGGFSQYVWNTRWDEDLNTQVAEGLRTVGASTHADWFDRRLATVASVQGQAGLPGFLASEYFGENAYRDSLDDDGYYGLPSLPDQVSSWIVAHPDLQAHSVEEMFARAEGIVGHPISRT